MKAAGGGLFGALALLLMLPLGVAVLLYGIPILLLVLWLARKNGWLRREMTHFVLAFPEEYAHARHEMRAANR